MKRISIFTLILTLAVTACQEGVIEQNTVLFDSEMRFNISTPGVQTKVANGAFEINDKIGLYVTDYASDNVPMPLQLSGNRANNMSLNYDGANWTPQESIYWGSGKSDIYAYYPYSSEISDVNDQYFELALDQTGEGYESSDFLWAKATGLKQTDGAVNLAMKHVMSKITVHLVAGDDYIGSLPEDASILLHSTVTAGRIDLEKGAISKDSYSGAKSIQMKNLGVQTQNDVKMVVYEAIAIPQMLENSVPLFEINSKSVSYLIEDEFNFRPGVAYTYTITLNTSTNSIKVDIGCEIEDWDNPDSGESGGTGSNGGGGNNDDKNYSNLSFNETANCYLIKESGDYKFKAVMGNSDITVGNVKKVDVLWESFGTNVMPNVGDIIAQATYSDGYIRFSTPENFKEGNAVVAAKNSKGMILWSWHIWCSSEGWEEQEYYNNAGTMMDRNLGATSAVPGADGSYGLLYQWGRKDPFMAPHFIDNEEKAASTGSWSTVNSSGSQILSEENPTTLYTSLSLPNTNWTSEKTIYDPCPSGWRVPDGGPDGIWMMACASKESYDKAIQPESIGGLNLSKYFGEDEVIWYPPTGFDTYTTGIERFGEYWSCTPYNYSGNLNRYMYHMYFGPSDALMLDYYKGRAAQCAVRCQRDDKTTTSGNEGVSTNEGNGVWEPIE